MTEQEIINVLKENKTKGIAFGFMPDEVIQFALKHKENLKFHDSEGFWIDTECQHKEGYDISIHEIVCLPEDFELKKESEGEWVEFEINQNGIFRCFMNGESHYFFWANWSAFLTEAYSFGYRAFGGWKYPHSNTWSMSPQVQLGRGAQNYSGYYSTELEDDARPAIPIKIRFWRISK